MLRGTSGLATSPIRMVFGRTVGFSVITLAGETRVAAELFFLRQHGPRCRRQRLSSLH